MAIKRFLLHKGAAISQNKPLAAQKQNHPGKSDDARTNKLQALLGQKRQRTRHIGKNDRTQKIDFEIHQWRQVRPEIGSQAETDGSQDVKENPSIRYQDYGSPDLIELLKSCVIIIAVVLLFSLFVPNNKNHSHRNIVEQNEKTNQ